MAPTSSDVAPTRADFNYNVTLNGIFFSLQYQNDTKESKRFQAKYQEIIIMPFIHVYVYGRQVGIGRSQVGTDRYKSGFSLHKSELGLHTSRG